MSRSNLFGPLASAPGRACICLRPEGAAAENAFTPTGAGAPGTNGLPTAGSIATRRATGLPVRSISATFCANCCGLGGGTRRATIGRSVLTWGIALARRSPPADTTRLARPGTTPTAVNPITGARSSCARSTRIGRTA